MLPYSGVSFGWALVLATANFIVCTWLEYRFRQKIRDGLIDESKYSKRRLAEIQRIRENMLAKDKRVKQ